MRLEANSVEVEEAREIATEWLLLVSVKHLQICRYHEYQAIGAYTSVVWHTQECIIENLLDDHHNWPEVFPLQHQLLDVINCIDTTVSFGDHGRVLSVILHYLLSLLVNTDVNFQVPHLLVDYLFSETECFEVDLFFFHLEALGWKLELLLLLETLLLTVPLDLLDSLVDLTLVDGLKVDDELDDGDVSSMNELHLINLTVLLQE